MGCDASRPHIAKVAPENTAYDATEEDLQGCATSLPSTAHTAAPAHVAGPLRGSPPPGWLSVQCPACGHDQCYTAHPVRGVSDPREAIITDPGHSHSHSHLHAHAVQQHCTSCAESHLPAASADPGSQTMSIASIVSGGVDIRGPQRLCDSAACTCPRRLESRSGSGGSGGSGGSSDAGHGTTSADGSMADLLDPVQPVTGTSSACNPPRLRLPLPAVDRGTSSSSSSSSAGDRGSNGCDDFPTHGSSRGSALATSDPSASARVSMYNGGDTERDALRGADLSAFRRVVRAVTAALWWRRTALSHARSKSLPVCDHPLMSSRTAHSHISIPVSSRRGSQQGSGYTLEQPSAPLPLPLSQPGPQQLEHAHQQQPAANTYTHAHVVAAPTLTELGSPATKLRHSSINPYTDGYGAEGYTGLVSACASHASNATTISRIAAGAHHEGGGWKTPMGEMVEDRTPAPGDSASSGSVPSHAGITDCGSDSSDMRKVSWAAATAASNTLCRRVSRHADTGVAGPTSSSSPIFTFTAGSHYCTEFDEVAAAVGVAV